MLVSVALDCGEEGVEVSVRPWPKRFGYTIHDVGDWLLIRLYAGTAEGAPTFVTEIDLQAQRPFDRHLPIAEGGVRKDFRLLGFLEREEGVTDALDVLLRQLAVFLAEVLAQRLVPLGRVDELYFALAMLALCDW